MKGVLTVTADIEFNSYYSLIRKIYNVVNATALMKTWITTTEVSFITTR